MKLIRGKKVANEILRSLRTRIENLKIKPTLAVILVGENKASKLYVKLKTQTAKKIGMSLILYKFKNRAKEKSVVKLIKSLNRDGKIKGIIVQLPLPKKFDTAKVIRAISPEKDADGFHPKNVENFLKGKKGISPVFPRALMRLLATTGVVLKNKKAVVIANSEIFGAIMKMFLEKRGASVEVILRFILNRKLNLLKEADIVITAVGKPGLIKGSLVKKGVVIIDGGITKREKTPLGDVDLNSVVKHASFLSPVPGGVGPVTVACLLENVYKLTLAKRGNK